MALEINDKGNRIIITGTTSSKELVKEGPIFITSWLWKNPTAIGNIANFIDDDNDFEFGARCVVANQYASDDWPTGYATIGSLYCDDLDAGTFVIYYKTHG